MSWLKRLWGAASASNPPEAIRLVRLTMTGWSERNPSGELRIWRNSHGDVLSLAASEWVSVLAHPSNEGELQRWSRLLAEDRAGGLIETSAVTCPMGNAVRLIYKRLQKPAYIYTGMLIVPMQGGSVIWTLVAGECGTTGVREAVVTAELMNAGKLTLQDYQPSRAQDPYDPTYRGVDRSVLRFVSDDESYDNRFPHHPLSRVRRVLAELPNSFQFDPQGSHGSGA